jgi:hypothetical protein
MYSIDRRRTMSTCSGAHTEAAPTGIGAFAFPLGEREASSLIAAV